MNILFFCRLFYPHIGGVEKHVLEISKLLIKKGHKVTVVTEQSSPKTKLNEKIEGIEVYRIPNLKDGKLKKFKIWKWLWDHYELMEDADIVHCHDVFFWYLPFRFMFPFKKVFTTFHGYEGYPIKKKSILVRKISEKLSNGNICVGDFIKKWYGTKPNYIIYGGVNLPDEKLQKKIKVKKHSAIFIGRLDEQTGILEYSKAVEIVRKKIPDFEFLVIGEGDCKSKISRVARVLSPRENALEYLPKYNFAFAPGYLSILEAMAAKKLVFSVYTDPIRKDYLQMSPFSKYISISNSIKDLVYEINYYIDNGNVGKKMIEKAYFWIEGNTMNDVVNVYLRLWRI